MSIDKRVTGSYLLLFIATTIVIYINSKLPYPPVQLKNTHDIIQMEVKILPYLLTSLAVCLIASSFLSLAIYRSVKAGIYYGGFLWVSSNLILAFYGISTFKLIPAFKIENYLVIISYIFFIFFTIYIVKKIYKFLISFDKNTSCQSIPQETAFLFLPALIVYLYSYLFSWLSSNYFDLTIKVLILLASVLIYFKREKSLLNKYFSITRIFVINKINPIIFHESFFLAFIVLFALVPRLYASHIIALELPNNLGGPDSDLFHLRMLPVIDDLSKIFSPLSWRKPGVQLFLLPIYSYFGPNPTIARYFFILVGVLSCVLTYFIGKKMFGKRVGALAAYFHAGYNYLIWNETWIATEGITIFLIEIFVLLLLKVQENESRSKSQYPLLYLGGLCFGYSILTRPEYLFFPIFFLIWLCIYERNKVYSFFVMYVLGVFSILLPWIIRNYIVYGKFYIIYLPVTGTVIPGGLKEIGVDMLSLSSSIISILSHFPEFVKTILFSEKMHTNLFSFLYWNQHNPYNPSDFIFFRYGTLFYSLGHIFLWVFTIIGLITCLKSFLKPSLIILLLIAYKTIITYLTFYNQWYRATIEPYILLLAALGIITTVRLIFNENSALAGSRENIADKPR